MLFHGSFGVLGPLGYITSLYGHWAVDLFFFVSGFGIYRSLSKRNNILSFYCKRLIRVFPAAIIVGFTLFLLGKTSFLGVFGLNLWFIRSILIMYLLSPLVFKMLLNYNPEKVFIITALTCCVSVALCVQWHEGTSFLFQSTVTWTFARFSSFVFGMLIAHRNGGINLYSKKVFMFSLFVLLAILMMIRIFFKFGYSPYLDLIPYTFLALLMPLFCVIIFAVYAKMPSFIKRLVEIVGCLSLEIYLVHECIFSEVKKLDMGACSKFAIAYAGSILLACILHFTVSKGTRLMRKLSLR